MMDTLTKRFFYLMLSIARGQSYANSMGFSFPSEDVGDAETVEILQRWALFINEGIFDEVVVATDWMLDLLEGNDKLVTPREELHPLFVSFGIALVNMLLDVDNLAIVLQNPEDYYE